MQNNDNNGYAQDHNWPCDIEWKIQRLGEAKIIQENKPLTLVTQLGTTGPISWEIPLSGITYCAKKTDTDSTETTQGGNCK